MRYTPGRWGNEATKSLASNLAKLHRTAHDIAEHFRRQPPRLGVIAAAVVGVDQMQAIDQVFCGVPELVGTGPFAERYQHRIVGNAPQCQDDLEARERGNLGGNEAIAAPE